MAASIASSSVLIRSAPARRDAGLLEARVARFTACHLGVPAARVTQAARLREDLGLNDDAAIVFFEEFGRQFGVNLDTLFGRYWARHFGPLGLSWGSFGLMALAVASAGFLLGFGASVDAWLLWASLVLLECFALGGAPFLNAGFNLTPVRVSELVASARSGFWCEGGCRIHSRRARARRRA